MNILFALASVHNKEPLFLANANSVFLEREFSEFVTYSLLLKDVDGAIAVTRHLNDKKPLGVAMNDEDTILKFNDSKDGYSWFNGGIYYLAPKILSETNYAFQADMSGIEKFLQLLIAGGYILKAFSFSKIINVESAADIIKAEELIRGIE
jgi:NDP-sugar pyrophosphorylase family protein